MNMKELTALFMRVLTEQSLGQLARLADFSVNQIRDLARATMIAHVIVQVLAGVLAVSGVLALTIGWAIYGDASLEGWDTVFYINCGLFTGSILLIIITLKRYSIKRNHFGRETSQLTRNLTDSLMSGFASFQKEHSLHKQDERLENLEKSIELIAQALTEESRYFGPAVVPKPKDTNERKSTNA